tara:strand:- start:630 stop:773 length:144 start_codon:yes stop_codon:yes gene_type:complete
VSIATRIDVGATADERPSDVADEIAFLQPRGAKYSAYRLIDTRMKKS